jgi:hypothetical protein
MSRTHDVTISAFDLDRLEREVINWKTAHDIAIEQRDRAQDAIETMLRDSTCRRIPAYTKKQLEAVEGGGDE